jgi:hypothetical protein
MFVAGRWKPHHGAETPEESGPIQQQLKLLWSPAATILAFSQASQGWLKQRQSRGRGRTALDGGVTGGRPSHP